MVRLEKKKKKKRLGADYEQFLRAVFLCFHRPFFSTFFKDIVASALKSCILSLLWKKNWTCFDSFWLKINCFLIYYRDTSSRDLCIMSLITVHISITSCNWNCNLQLGTYRNVSQDSHLKNLQQFWYQTPCRSDICTNFLQFFFTSEIPEVSESLHFISLVEGISPKGHTSPGKRPIVY